MAWVAVIGTAVAAAPAIYKGIQGISQSNKANAINPQNPGYQLNYGTIDNARTLSDEYGNYQLPGYAGISGVINANFSNAFNAGVKGASSGNDILGLATKIAYGKNQAYNQLGEENATGKQGILASYLNSNEKAGQQYQDMNAYQRQQYEEQLRQKAALTQAGATNTYGALDQLSSLGSKYAFSQAGNTKKVAPPAYAPLDHSDPNDPNS